MTELFKATPSGERKCVCVKRHSPEPRELHRHHVWPLGEGGPTSVENLRWLCPTTHSNVHMLWREYDNHGGEPPWVIRKTHTRYVRALVAEGWAKMKEAS